MIYTVLVSAFFSCADQDVENKKDNFPYKEGNYWVYKLTLTYPDGSVYVDNDYDSVWIVKDTVINRKAYWLQAGTQSGSIYLRDSADCVLRGRLIVDEIIYASNRDTLFSNPPAYKINTDIGELVHVPAGDFRTTNCRTIIRRDPNDSGHNHGLPLFTDDFFTGEQYICSDKIGLVKHVYYSFGVAHEYELSRYELH